MMAEAPDNKQGPEGKGAEESKEKNAETTSDTEEKRRKSGVIYRLLKIHTKFRGFVLFAAILAWMMAIGASVYFCWFYLIPIVWNWGFDPPTWKAILSVLGAFYLVLGPILPLTYGWDFISLIMSSYVDEREEAVKSKLKDLSRHQKSAEERLVAEDKTGLIPLIQYSRIQLESYYVMGLSQAQRSFRYSILAMWIGFVVIISGTGLSLFPFGDSELRASISDIRIVTISGGVVIELISALFLWIYRSSINQLNYFYNRQMHLHNVIVCDRIATSMSNPDETKRLIVEKVLSSAWDIKPLAAPGDGVSKLIKGID